MKLFANLFTTDYGLLALAIGMRIFIVKKMRESDEAQ